MNVSTLLPITGVKQISVPFSVPPSAVVDCKFPSGSLAVKPSTQISDKSHTKSESVAGQDTVGALLTVTVTTVVQATLAPHESVTV